MWNPEGVDDQLWQRLGAHFTEEQMVELGYFVALTFGQQRWIKTLDIGHNEVRVPTVTDPAAEHAGLAPQGVAE